MLMPALKLEEKKASMDWVVMEKRRGHVCSSV
jgi:hypothetical protein